MTRFPVTTGRSTTPKLIYPVQYSSVQVLRSSKSLADSHDCDNLVDLVAQIDPPITCPGHRSPHPSYALYVASSFAGFNGASHLCRPCVRQPPPSRCFTVSRFFMPLAWTTFQIRGANRDSFFDLDCLSLDLWQRTYAILQFIVRQ